MHREEASLLEGRKVLILIGSHLATAPRPVKEIGALRKVGAHVWVRGTWWSDRLAKEDFMLARELGVEYVPVLDLRPGAKGRFVIRLKHRLARELYRRLGWASARCYGIGGPEFLREIRRLSPDAVIAHSEATLWAATKLQKSKIRIGVDMEDWFSEDFSPSGMRERPLSALKQMEGTLLRRAAFRFCPSFAMSTALAREYGCRRPTVVYNVFPWSERERLDGLVKDRVNALYPSLHWYSQTLGPGRGLEDLVAALAFLKRPLEIHLRGNPAAGFENWLWDHVSPRWRALVFIHPPVTNAELLSRISEHDIGFAGEMKHCRSRNLTVTNKTFHYLLAGLAVVASDTEGQREIAIRAPEAFRVYPSGDPVALAEQLESLIASRETLLKAKADALRVARDHFCWERMAPALVQAVCDGIGGKS